jgi:hypothetical protein
MNRIKQGPVRIQKETPKKPSQDWMLPSTISSLWSSKVFILYVSMHVQPFEDNLCKHNNFVLDVETGKNNHRHKLPNSV